MKGVGGAGGGVVVVVREGRGGGKGEKVGPQPGPPGVKVGRGEEGGDVVLVVTDAPRARLGPPGPERVPFGERAPPRLVGTPNVEPLPRDGEETVEEDVLVAPAEGCPPVLARVVVGVEGVVAAAAAPAARVAVQGDLDAVAPVAAAAVAVRDPVAAPAPAAAPPTAAAAAAASAPAPTTPAVL